MDYMARKTGAYAWLDQHGVKLYENGAIDKQLARAAGCVNSTVLAWRRKRGLPPNAPQGSEDWRACHHNWIQAYTDVVKCIEAGMTDAEGAAYLGIDVANYRGRRLRYRLKPGRYERVQSSDRYEHPKGKLRRVAEI